MFRTTLTFFSLIGAALAAPDTEATLSFALAPPANPLPTLTSLVSHLEARDKRLNEEGIAKIQAAYDAALKSAKAEIDAIVSSKHSFLQTREPVRVKVLSTPGVAGSNLARVEQMAAVREDAEAKKIDQAAAEFGAIARIAINELKSAMGTSFLKARSDMNVQVHASKIAFPTVLELLQGMAAHADASDATL